MNYYERHIGDYLKDTAHLSLLEHGVYTRLMDVYYTREGAIPAAEVARLVGARSKDEREALQAVLGEFFQLVDGAHAQARCDREIARFKDKQAKAKRSADARWAKPETHSEGNADASPDAMRTHSEGNAPRARPQSPVTSNQETPIAPLGAADGAAGDTHGQTIPCPYDRIVGLYHEILPGLPKAKLMPTSRQKALRKVWGWVLSSTKGDGQRRATTTDEALLWLRGYFGRASANDFLMGRTPRSAEHANWQCDLDFLLTDKGMKQVIEKTQDAA